jgi:hypothetical protein
MPKSLEAYLSGLSIVDMIALRAWLETLTPETAVEDILNFLHKTERDRAYLNMARTL